MIKTPLTQQQIKELLKFEQNRKIAYATHKPAFSKQQTLAILNAVTDGLTITANGQFAIHYQVGKYGEQRFFVQATGAHTPCGNFVTEWALDRLSL